MVTLYIETNFFISFAKNQDENCNDLVNPQSPDDISNLKIVTPAICCMESFSVLEDERMRRNSFTEKLEKEIKELRGNINSTHSQEILNYLTSAKSTNNNRMANDIENRLFEVLQWAANNVELVNLESSVLINSLEKQLIPDPTDNLILHCILAHAQISSDEIKVLLTGNSKHFGTKEIKQILNEAGIGKYIASTADFLGWFKSI